MQFTERATNINNQGPDTAAIDAFCGLILKEPECAQIAAKFITAKVHSLQEWEALQALIVSDIYTMIIIVNNYRVILPFKKHIAS